MFTASKGTHGILNDYHSSPGSNNFNSYFGHTKFLPRGKAASEILPDATAIGGSSIVLAQLYIVAHVLSYFSRAKRTINRTHMVCMSLAAE